MKKGKTLFDISEEISTTHARMTKTLREANIYLQNTQSPDLKIVLDMIKSARTYAERIEELDRLREEVLSAGNTDKLITNKDLS